MNIQLNGRFILCFYLLCLFFKQQSPLEYFSLILFVFVQYRVVFKLSVNDVIVSQKSSNGEGEQHFFERDYKRSAGLKNIFLNVCVRDEGTKCQSQAIFCQRLKMLLNMSERPKIQGACTKKTQNKTRNKPMETAQTILN